MSKLQISILQAILTKNYDAVGKMENFLVIKLIANGQTTEYKTDIAQGQAKKPIVWKNKNIEIPIPAKGRGNARLQIYLMDQDQMSNDLCGQGIINLENCQFFTPGKKIYSIRLHDGQNVEATGDLLFSSSFV